MNQRIRSKQASMMGSSPLEMAWLAGAVMAGFVKIFSGACGASQ
jgi:hypothetical protein